jgi:hypothetical protein
MFCPLILWSEFIFVVNVRKINNDVSFSIFIVQNYVLGHNTMYSVLLKRVLQLDSITLNIIK